MATSRTQNAAEIAEEQSMTISEWLETLGGVDRVKVNIPPQWLDNTCEPELMSTDGTGALQFTCGGDVIARLYRAPVGRTRIYLVRDDSDGKAWDARRRNGDLAGRCAFPPRPHAVLRLVASA